MGEDLVAHAARLLRQARIPDYRFPERAASALRVLADRARLLETPEERPIDVGGVDRDAARRLLRATRPGTNGFVDPQTAAAVIASYGIAVPPATAARSEAEAADAAVRIGWPVVAKLISPDRSHKSDIGGVVVGLRSEDELRQAYRQITAGAEQAGAAVAGVLVQSMSEEGQEVIIGVVRDEQFGALVMFGSGGVEVEGLRDVAFALAPLTAADGRALLDSTWAGRRLAGFRSLAAGDRAAVVDALARLGRLVTDYPEVLEIEINPLRVLPPGKGVLALDVRLRLTSPA